MVHRKRRFCNPHLSAPRIVTANHAEAKWQGNSVQSERCLDGWHRRSQLHFASGLHHYTYIAEQSMFIDKMKITAIFWLRLCSSHESQKIMISERLGSSCLRNQEKLMCANAQPSLCNELGPVQVVLGILLGPFSGDLRQFQSKA